MGNIDHRRLAAGLVGPVQRAGAIVMDYYTNGVATEQKADASPVTAADRDAEAVLAPALAALMPEIKIIAEEAAAAEGVTLEPGALFALIDPLDGTKEFLSGETDFTLNVALVDHVRPCFGLVYAPALSELFVTLAEDEAVLARLEPGGAKALDDLELTPLHTRALPERLAAMASRSHLNPATQAYLERLPVGETVTAGSSLKFCRIAQAKADVYPRLARTMEWDTAAGDAVLRAAGGTVLDETGAPLTYGKAQGGYANGSFVAWGRMPRPEFAAAKAD